MARTMQTARRPRPPAFEYEFFGPYGPIFMMLSLPFVVLGLVYACNAHSCLSLWPPPLTLPAGLPPGQRLYTHEAMAAVLGWFAFVVALHLLLPGERARGAPLADGRRLEYKLNGAFVCVAVCRVRAVCAVCVRFLCVAPRPSPTHNTTHTTHHTPFPKPPPTNKQNAAFAVFAVTYGTAAALSFGLGVLDLTWAADNFLPLLTASLLASTALAAACYASSLRRPRAALAAGGDSGFAPYDFWMGRELNPRLRLPFTSSSIDLKEFCELYPGMIGWALLNLSFAYAQYKQLGYVTNAMLLVNAFELWYIADGLFNERAILTTMDITTDGFGFMLSFGDLCWVPFTFSTQARYLRDWPRSLGPSGLAAVLAVQLAGYAIFRGANGQKDAFRRDPSAPGVAHLESMPTARGTRLLVSGWWGAARHVNYFGDWLMGLAWCMPAGLAGAASVVPYFYCLYFGALLAHRERRDEHACRRKYGAADWGAYCARVPWRIIPYVY
jgi:hypothetical protein